MNLMQRAAITITCEVGQRYGPFVRRHLRAAFAHVRKAPAILSVALVTSATITRLNRQFLGRPRVTDVLAFEISRDAQGRTREGEIVVCLDLAQRQAQRRGHPVESELLLYALHGLLHLCGYDDTSPGEADRMHAREDEILQAIGIGPVFAPAAPRRRASPPANAVAGRRASS